MKPSIDIKAFPIVVITIHGNPTANEIDAHYEHMRRLLSQGRVVVITDLNLIAEVPSPARRQFADGADKMTADFPGVCQGEGAFANSVLVRGMFTAYQWVKRDRSYPVRCFVTRQEAINWATSILRASNIVPPAA